MEQIAPYSQTFLLPEGSLEALYAANQPEYSPLPSIVTPDGRVVSQWKPTDEELKRIIAGEPITLVMLTFGMPLQPVIVAVGGLDLR